jgi:hypothetical protein
MTDLVDPLGAAAPQQNDSTVDISDQPGAQQLPDGGLLSGDGDPALEGVPESYSFDMPADSGLEMTEEIQAALNEFSSACAKRHGALAGLSTNALVEYRSARGRRRQKRRSVGEWVERVNNWKSSALKDQGDRWGENYPEAQSLLRPRLLGSSAPPR